MTKQDQIEAKRNKPIAIGDTVAINVPYTTTNTITEGKGKKKVTKTIEVEAVFKTEGTVTAIKPKTKIGLIYEVRLSSVRVPSEVQLKDYSTRYESSIKHDCFKAEHVSPTYGECGANPFKKERFRVDFYNQNVDTLLFKACYNRRSEDGFAEPHYDKVVDNGTQKDKNIIGKTHGGIDFNPFVIDANGKKQYYQRDLIWTLKQKQLLIDSIYNGIEIGKFLFRYRSWAKIEEGMLKDGHGYHWECVDGKQRFFAILHFVQNKYPDSNGNYWEDLCPMAQARICNYHNLSYGEMGENAKDSDVIETFLTMNFSGTPMSPEHIAFVQSFKM